jgi:hypothetical protein
MCVDILELPVCRGALAEIKKRAILRELLTTAFIKISRTTKSGASESACT